MIARTHAAGVEEVVVKRGADACSVSVSGQPLREVPAVRLAKEKVVDTTAAGDSFSAGYRRSPDRRRCRIRRQTRTPDRQHGDPVSRGDHPGKRCRSNSPHKALSGRRWRAGEALGYCPGGMSLASLWASTVSALPLAAVAAGFGAISFSRGLQLLHIVFRFALRLLQHQRHVLRELLAQILVQHVHRQELRNS